VAFFYITANVYSYTNLFYLSKYYKCPYYDVWCSGPNECICYHTTNPQKECFVIVYLKIDTDRIGVWGMEPFQIATFKTDKYHHTSQNTQRNKFMHCQSWMCIRMFYSSHFLHSISKYTNLMRVFVCHLSLSLLLMFQWQIFLFDIRYIHSKVTSRCS